MVMAMGTVMAWLRTVSRSLWPPAVLHASHNLLVQGVFDAGTTAGPWSGYLTGEFGVGLVLTIGVVAWLMVKNRSLAPAPG
jgi:membrane protease YdiL (CAAX protease family)